MLDKQGQGYQPVWSYILFLSNSSNEIVFSEINLNRVVILIINSKMDRHRTAAPRGEESRNRHTAKIKENPLNDAVYLIQNENDVLRMKYSLSHSGMKR